MRSGFAPVSKGLQAYPGCAGSCVVTTHLVRPRIQPELARLVSDALAVLGLHRLITVSRPVPAPTTH